MGRLANPRAALVASASLLVVALIWVAVSSSSGTPDTSLASSGGTATPRTNRTASSADDEPTASSSADPTAGESTTTAPPTGTSKSRTATRTGSKASTTTTAATGASPTSTIPSPLTTITAPPAPDDDHITFWGRALDETGRPVADACVRLVQILPIVPNTIGRTRADGSYAITISHPTDDPAPYAISVAACPDHPIDVLGDGVMSDAEYNPLRAERGDLRRTDFTMPLAPTTIDVEVVDPAGRPVLGVCIGWYDSDENASKRVPVDSRGHVVIDRPGTRNTAIHMLGDCDHYLGFGASTMYLQADFVGGHNDIRLVVPWNSGDDFSQPVTVGYWDARFDLISLSTQPGELDPSCVGAFTRSRWFQLDSKPFPGLSQTGGPILGGKISTSLSRGGTFAVWGLDGTGQVREIGCAPAGTPIPIPGGVYSSVRIQVIPANDLAEVGSFEWGLNSGG